MASKGLPLDPEIAAQMGRMFAPPTAQHAVQLIKRQMPPKPAPVSYANYYPTFEDYLDDMYANAQAGQMLPMRAAISQSDYGNAYNPVTEEPLHPEHAMSYGAADAYGQRFGQEALDWGMEAAERRGTVPRRKGYGGGVFKGKGGK